MLGAATDTTERIKWWDVLDKLLGCRTFWLLNVVEEEQQFSRQLEQALQMARECRHEDAQWLSALFPPGTPLTSQHVLDVLRAQGDDPRALFVMWTVQVVEEEVFALVERAAALGYAPAQAAVSAALVSEAVESLEWATKAASQGDRRGLYLLAERVMWGRGCARDNHRALELFEEAAELGQPEAQVRYGRLRFPELDWRRYRWWCRAAVRGCEAVSLCKTAVWFLRFFEEGRMGRVLFEVAPVIRLHLDLPNERAFGKMQNESDLEKLQRVVALHEARCDLCRCAIDCWTAVARRRGVVKDIRVVIARMLWEQRWLWGEAKEEEEEEEAEAAQAQERWPKSGRNDK